MSAWRAMQRLIEVLDGLPEIIIPAGHVSASRPTAVDVLPAIVVWVTDVTDLPAGVGGLVGTRRLSDTAWSTATASRASGIMALELWAADASVVMNLGDAVVALLEGSADVTGAAGFLRLAVQSAGPMEPTKLATQADAFMLPIACSFVFEDVSPDEPDPGGVIKQVHADLTDTFHEVVDLP